MPQDNKQLPKFDMTLKSIHVEAEHRTLPAVIRWYDDGSFELIPIRDNDE